MRNLFRLIAVCFLFFSLGTAWAQRDFSQAKIKAEQVRGNIYMLTGPGGNIGASVGEDGTLIIDDKFAPLADKIRAALKSVGGGELKFILNTHWHGDHTGANPVFGPEATILAHTNVRKRLTGELKMAGNPGQPAPKEGWPVITFDQSLSIHFNGEEINVIHFPHGHTDGDSVIFFTKSNVVHMGDDFFAGRFPFVDLGSGGDVAGLVKNISAVIKKLPADVKIIPGHGPLSTVDDLKKYHRMLKETTEAVRRQMQAAKSLDEIKAAGLASEWKSWGAGFINEERWIGTIYHSYSR
ncbi:MAG: MBL fold metallo-hydrolase [Acidobacteria bacterium]|nr:MBL fold metallo-hydrolase [Acidobacteriota bacterium]